MGHYMPGSQSRALMAQKEKLAAQLLSRGLRTSQVAAQLKCSQFFVRKIRNSLDADKGAPNGN
jgi:DNA-binding CsgD family transcriptional regulator